VVVGASTGGPQALTHLVGTLPAEFPTAMALVLHLPADYTAPFAARLNGVARVEVLEASDGLPLVPGRVVVARGGVHMKVARDAGGLVTRLEMAPVHVARAGSAADFVVPVDRQHRSHQGGGSRRTGAGVKKRCITQQCSILLRC